MNTNLPQVCVRCRKLKALSLGKLIKTGGFSRRVFVCDACLEKPAILRVCRKNQESFPEKLVREALQESGFFTQAEFPLGKFIYDFAVPRLRLLLEIDSKRYHRFPSQLKRDRIKSATAKREEWDLERLPASESVGVEALLAVNKKAALLGLK